MKQRFACWLLATVETYYLRTFGWCEVGIDSWQPPDDYAGKLSAKHKGHAVNSQRYFERYKSVPR